MCLISPFLDMKILVHFTQWCFSVRNFALPCLPAGSVGTGGAIVGGATVGGASCQDEANSLPISAPSKGKGGFLSASLQNRKKPLL